MPDSFTDIQLRALIGNPDFTGEDFKLLSPEEQARFAAIKGGKTYKAPGSGSGNNATGTALDSEPSMLQRGASSAVEGLKNLGIGAAKGIGNTAKNLRANYDAHGDEGDRQTFAAPVGANFDIKTADLDPEGVMQKIGKSGEQVAEFLPGGKPLSRGLTEIGAQALPNSLSPGAMKIGNKLASILGRVGGEGLNAAGIAASHGDSPTIPVLLAGSSPLAAEGAAAAAPLLQGPILSQIIPMGAATAIGHALGGVTSGMGLGGGLMTWGMARKMVDELLSSPNATKTLQQGARRLLPVMGRVTAGIQTQEQDK